MRLFAIIAYSLFLAEADQVLASPSPVVMSTNPATVKVAAIQCSSVLGDVTNNIRKLTALVKEAAASGAKIVVMPEAAVTGYLSQDLHTNWCLSGKPIEGTFTGVSPSSAAQRVPGPTTEYFSKLSKSLGIYLTVAFVECSTGDAGSETTNYFNSACLISPQGKMVAHYRKLTPWPYPEKSWATAGNRDVQTFDTEYGRVGLGICFDIHTILEKYEPHHIWALLYPIAWVEQNHPADWFWHRLPKRVAKFHHYVIGANWSVDEPQPWYGYGFSEIISPDGEIVAAAHSLYGSEIVYATIPTGKTAAVKLPKQLSDGAK
jgi:predicted amidohydrolase